MEGRSASGSGRCKIRKRGCSSSSSSSLVRRYRLKRTVLVGKRTGSTTPVPSWIVSSKSPAPVVPSCSSFLMGPVGEAQGKDASVSARKLGATLWEINEVPSPVKRDKIVKGADCLKDGKQQRRALAVTNGSTMEMESHCRGKNRPVDGPTRLKDLLNSIITSKELLKVLYRVGSFRKQQLPSTISLVSALGAELDRARSNVVEIIQESRTRQREIEFLINEFAEEKAKYKAKEGDRVRNTVAHIAQELEAERKLRRQTERLNKKLGEELLDAKGSLSEVLKELDSERRAKKILEQVCDELARGIGEDKAEAEEMKRESEKVLEEVEKEREMLQLADVLREERVQMKLSEAKYDFEEKNAAVERLRSQLEICLKATKMGKVEEENGESDDDSSDGDLRSIEWSFGDGIGGVDSTNKRDPVDKELPFKGRRSLSEKIQWASISLKRGTLDGQDLEVGSNGCDDLNGFDRGRLLEFVSHAQAKNKGDESKKCRVPGFGVVSLQPVASPTRKWGHVEDPIRDVRENSTSDVRPEAMRAGTEGANLPSSVEA